ncbi:MAG: hypothetical protein GTO04_03580, partial [Planctomycetales bacterium]|nr:hypothetical protein [Planctomycetales bacterium]
DARATVRWLQEMAVRSRVELTREMPPPARQMLDDVGQPGVRQRLTRLLWQRWQRGGHPVSPALTDQDIARLRESLSPQGRRLLEEAPDIRKALRKLVGKGLESSRRPPLAGHQEGHDSSRPWSAERMFSAFAENPAMQPVLSDEALLGFFREQLDRDQQERLKRLPPDQFLRVLRQEYYRSQFGGPQPHDMMPRGRRPHPPPPSLWRHGSTDGFHRPPSDDARRHKAINPPPEAWPSDQVPERR